MEQRVDTEMERTASDVSDDQRSRELDKDAQDKDARGVQQGNDGAGQDAAAQGPAENQGNTEQMGQSLGDHTAEEGYGGLSPDEAEERDRIGAGAGTTAAGESQSKND